MLKAPEGLFSHSVNIHTSAALLGSEDARMSKQSSLPVREREGNISSKHFCAGDQPLLSESLLRVEYKG